MPTRLSQLALSLVLVGTALGTLPIDAQSAEPRAVPVEAAEVRVAAVRHEITAVGSLLADESVMLRFEIAGRIRDIGFADGETVEQGRALLALDPAELQAELAESAAAVDLDTLSFDRAKDLLARELASRQQYDEALARLSASRARQAVNEARLAKATLRAPFAGVLGFRLVSPGDYVQPGQDIVTLEAVDPLKVDFRVGEMHAAQIRPGQEVTVRVDAFPDRSFTGQVGAIAPRIEEATRSVLVRALIPNPDHALRPGMFARVRLTLEERPDSLLVPEQALVPARNESFLYRIVDGKAVRTPVRPGLHRGGEVEILEGLSPGDTVVTAGQMKIGDGMPVTILSAPGS
jgi:membrane fusion protein, multidrug efflux system